MSPEQVANLLDEATRYVPVSTPLLALFGACVAAASLVLHAVAAYRLAQKKLATPAPKEDVRLPPPELPK